MPNTLIVPTVAAIEAGTITEGQNYEFKARLDVDDPRSKSNFIDDVVAFLNSGPGYLVVGVHEKKGAFQRFEPVYGDRDAIQRRVTSIMQDNIDPKPLHFRLHVLELQEEGFLLLIELPDHRMRPYQNRINGSFYRRTGAQNTPIPRDKVSALFTTIEQLAVDTQKLMERENAVVERRGIIQNNGATLQIAIEPIEHYELERPTFDPGRQSLKTMRYFHYNGSGVFNACDNGMEVWEKTFDSRGFSRFFIGDDWLVYSYVAHPISVTDGMLELARFRDDLTRYLLDIQVILEGSGIIGPFGISLSIRNLSCPRLQWAFRDIDTVSMSRPPRWERIDDEGIISRFYDKVRSASFYGQ